MPAQYVHDFFEKHANVKGYYAVESAALVEFFFECIDEHPQFFSGDILEIGTYEGRSARHLAMHVRPGETLHLCDPYDRFPEVVREVQEVCAGHVHGIHGFSWQIGPADIADRSVRLAYIDGEHGYRSLLNDMAIADRVLRPEGIAILDDFMNPEFMGVTIGAIEWMTLNPGKLQILLASTGKAVLCRPNFIPYLMRMIRDAMPRFFRECGYDHFTLSRGAWPSDCVTVGIIGRRFDLDFITRETDVNDMEAARKVRLDF